MKIVIKIPDWVSPDETLTILSGQELVAFKLPRQPFKIKIIRCNQCGECCLDIPEGHLPFGTNGEGKCNKLKFEDDKCICTAGHMKPFSCLNDPADISGIDCCIRYK